MRSVQHQTVKVGIAQRRDIAIALDAEFVEVHRQRDIDGENEFEIDRLLSRGGANGQCGAEKNGDGDSQDPKKHVDTPRSMRRALVARENPAGKLTFSRAQQPTVVHRQT